MKVEEKIKIEEKKLKREQNQKEYKGDIVDGEFSDNHDESGDMDLQIITIEESEKVKQKFKIEPERKTYYNKNGSVKSHPKPKNVQYIDLEEVEDQLQSILPVYLPALREYSKSSVLEISVLSVEERELTVKTLEFILQLTVASFLKVKFI